MKYKGMNVNMSNSKKCVLRLQNGRKPNAYNRSQINIRWAYCVGETRPAHSNLHFQPKIVHTRAKKDQTRPTKAKDIFRLCIAHSVGKSTQQSHITTFAGASLAFVKIEMRLFYVDYKPLWFSGCKEKKRPWEARALVVKYANVKLS